MPLQFLRLILLGSLVGRYEGFVEQVVVRLEALDHGQHPLGVQLLVSDVVEQLDVGRVNFVHLLQDAHQNVLDRVPVGWLGKLNRVHISLLQTPDLASEGTIHELNRHC